jgi:serine/threonine-protein kinase BUR1
MFMRKPILPGNSDADQLDKIFNLCGSPTQHSWPDFDRLPGCEGMRVLPKYPHRKLRKAYEMLVSLVQRFTMIVMLTCSDI